MSFDRDTNKIRNRKLLNNIAGCIEQVQRAKNITEIRNLKKLKGFKTVYRIKVSDYRIGIIIENEVIEFVRFLHRKDIYKFFPQ